MFFRTKIISVLMTICIVSMFTACRPVKDQISSSPEISSTQEKLWATTVTQTPALSENFQSTVVHTTTLTRTPSRTPNPPTLTRTPSWTPLPTLLPDQALEMVNTMRLTNGGCQIPCLWGITPGKSMWLETKAFLETFAYEIGAYHDPDRDVGERFYYSHFRLYDSAPTLDNILVLRMTIDTETGLINQITSSQEYELGMMIEQLGLPEHVLFTSTGIPETGPAAYGFELFYPNIGVSLGINGAVHRLTRDEGIDEITLCLETLQEDARGVRVWLPEKTRYFEKHYERLVQDHHCMPLSESTDMTILDFIEFLSGKSGMCQKFPLVW